MTAIWSRRSRRRRYTPKHQASRPRQTRSVSTLVGVLGGIVFLAALAGVVLLQAWPPAAVVRSGSMAPGIDVGDVVVMRSLGAADPKVGDVVEVPVPASAQRDLSYPPRVTHRVVAIEDGAVTTKGDALADPDPFTVPLASVETRVVAVVPYAGRVVAFVTSPLGLLWLGIGAAIFFIAPLHDLRRQPLVVAAPVRPSDEVVEIRETVRELVSAVGEYGEHLRSHTSVVQEMSHASKDLATVAARFEQVVDAPPPPSPPPASPRAGGGWRDLATLSETRRTITTARADLRRALGRSEPPAQ